MERKNKKYDDISSPIYSTIYKEYERMFERGRSIDSRAGLFLTFLFTSFPFYVQIVSIDYFYELLRKTCFTFSDVLLVIVFVLSTITFLSAFIFLLRSLMTRGYKILNNEIFKGIDIVEYEDNDTTINDINIGLIGLLHEYIEHNEKVFAKKAKMFDISLWLSFAFMALMVVTIYLRLF